MNKRGTRVLTSGYKSILAESKRSQLQISFGMIFSIILIIVFIAFAVYVIIRFVLPTGKCVETGLFSNELKDQIDVAFNSDELSRAFTFSLPAEIEKVCFVNLSKASSGNYKQYYQDFKYYGSFNLNTFFYPMNKTCEGQQGMQLKHLDINKMTETNNPYCINNVKGKVSININGYYGKLVVLS